MILPSDLIPAFRGVAALARELHPRGAARAAGIGALSGTLAGALHLGAIAMGWEMGPHAVVLAVAVATAAFAGLVPGIACTMLGGAYAAWAATAFPHSAPAVLPFLLVSVAAVLIVAALRGRSRLRALHLRQGLRRARQTRRQAESRLAGLDAAVWERDAETGGFRFMSEGAARVLGDPADRWLDHDDLWERRIHPDDRERVVSTYVGLDEGDSLRLEYRMLVGGVERWIRDDVSRGTGADGDLLRGVSVDVTDRRRAAEGEALAIQRHRDLFDGLPVGIYRAAADGTLIAANRVLAQTLGFGSVEALLRSCREDDLLPPEARWKWDESDASDGGSRTFEMHRPRNDGSPLWLRTTVRRTDGQADGQATGAAGRDGVVEDVTAQVVAEEARRAAESQFRGLVEQSLVGIYILQDDRVVYANPKLARIFGASPEEIVGLPSLDPLVAEDDRAEVKAYHRRHMLGEDAEPQHGFRGVRRDGTPLFAEVHVALTRYRGRRAIIGTLLDVTQRKAAERELVHNALHDALTGLPNRVLFGERLEHAVLRTRRAGHGFAVVFMDLDRFKYINDSFGHQAGDDLLVAVARRIQSALRPGDSVARMGGDEFALLLEEVEDATDAIRVVQRIQAAVSRPLDVGGYEIFTSSSVGIVLCNDGEARPSQLLRDADLAMYRAKEGGPGRHEVYDRSMHAETLGRLQLENDLRRAVEREELELHFQPIVAMGDARITSVEALLRWDHPERGPISPAEFVPVAEDTGLIETVGRWVLEKACARTARWRAEHPAAAGLSVAVNLSARQFLQNDIVSDVRSALASSGLDPRALCLEITESVLMENPEFAARVLVRLREIGVRVHLDDFGTGHCSLSYLHLLPFDGIKIDRSFVARVGEGGWEEHLVRTIVNLAHDLGVGVVTEGVETEDQLRFLQSVGSEEGQGYLFSRPVPVSEITRLLAAAGTGGVLRFSPPGKGSRVQGAA
jgi:diguanylate cyclase (GGDEF)-like protein/PAS domain S-box-containing protein